MKRTLQLLLALIIFITACKKDNITYAKQQDLENSYQKFVAFKNSNSNSYTYTTTFGSFTGLSGTTTISVVNGKVVSRSYKEYTKAPGSQQAILVVGWDEDQSNIGSHQQGSEALTLDQVYDKAKNVWLKVDTKTNDIYFSTDVNGLISSCGYVPKGCQDDCFTGINISSIVALH